MRFFILLFLCHSKLPVTHQVLAVPNNRTGGLPMVSVDQGWLMGRTLTTSGGTKYDAFSGIPYAARPVGELRFKGPRPPASWSGVRDARREGRICTQPLFNLTRVLFTRNPKSFVPVQSAEVPGLRRARPWIIRLATNILTSGEDCLFINVYTPRDAVRANREAGGRGLAVLFWIYGGGFIFGEGGMSFYDPDRLMDHGILVVTFNYRLGPLGFMSLGRGSGIPGNAGIKDQAFAFHWVRRNIAAFGGDPSRITVYGESAGAAGAHMHILHPQTGGLINNAILSSGSGVHYWAYIPASHALKRARHLAPSVRCSSSLSPRKLAKCFRTVHPQLLTGLQQKALIMHEDMRYVTGAVPFNPVVEETEDDLDEYDAPYLTEDPRKLIAAGRYAKIPILLGLNSGEGLIIFTGLTRDPSDATIGLIFKNVTSLLRDDLYNRISPTQAENIALYARKGYFGDRQGLIYEKDDFKDFLEMSNGAIMYLDTLMLARMLASEAGAAPVFLYVFKYVGAWNLFKNLLRIQQNETCHADELPYIWRMNLTPASRPVYSDSPENKVCNFMVTTISNFIKSGSPTPPASSLSPPEATWPPFTIRQQAYMDIGEFPSVATDYRRSFVAMWDQIYAKYVGGPIWSRLASLEAERS